MGKDLHNFSHYETTCAAIGSYEHQLKLEFEKEISELRKMVDELQTKFDDTFG